MGFAEPHGQSAAHPGSALAGHPDLAYAASKQPQMAYRTVAVAMSVCCTRR
jgi:hypothetical protein